SGVSSDLRDVRSAAENGNERAQLALDILAYQIKKYVGGYAAAMNGLDCVVFTAGIGENDATMRALAMRDLEFLGIKLDEEKNNSKDPTVISADDSRVKVLVIPTNEELVIASDTWNIVKNK
ncbi:MAG: acetate kinase, partial [Clostridia bacterium]|nr:acetate kinase [Clostridia bacterium]